MKRVLCALVATVAGLVVLLSYDVPEPAPPADTNACWAVDECLADADQSDDDRSDEGPADDPAPQRSPGRYRDLQR